MITKRLKPIVYNHVNLVDPVKRIQSLILSNPLLPPNGDGTNDVWTVCPSDENTLLEEVRLFDRWGNMMASWQGVPNFSWDEPSKGRLLEAGIFAYYIRYVDRQGKVVERKGDVMLVR